MTTQLITKEDDAVLVELQSAKKLCQQLMATPHYQKMGEVGIYAIIQKAKSMKMNVLDALNGGMYFVNGKVEMSGQAMLSVIRQHGHSVSMDPKSSNTHVRMFGKRADNGDSWCVEFSIEDAKKAGIYKNVWEKYPKTMCTWRCVSMLSRFLFSDILKGVYVQGEISEINNPDIALDVETGEIIDVKPQTSVQIISSDQAFELGDLIASCSPESQIKFDTFLKSNNIESIEFLPVSLYEKVKLLAIQRKAEYENSLKQEMKMEGSVNE